MSVAGATCTAVSVVTTADWRTALVGYETAGIDPSVGIDEELIDSSNCGNAYELNKVLPLTCNVAA